MIADRSQKERSTSSRRLLLALPGTTLLLLVLGCSSLGYVTQSLWGGASILRQRRPIERLLERGELSEDRSRRLELVLEILDFAHHELALPDNGSYRTFVEVDRPYVVWNVVAAPRFSVEPRSWCFPIAGCVAYRGYFSERKARRFADRLERRGLDVAVGGVTAYSTLGWFRDPVLSTFFGYADAELAGLLIHELAHQVIYVKGDSSFNESFATTVEEEGVRRWLESRGESIAWEDWRLSAQRRRRTAELLLDYRGRLEEVYGSAGDDEAKARRKAELLAELRRRLADLRRSWGGATDLLDDPIEPPLNNADLAAVGTYWEHVAALRVLLARTGGELARFYEAVAEIGGGSDEERRQNLARLATEAEGRGGASSPSAQEREIRSLVTSDAGSGRPK